MFPVEKIALGGCDEELREWKRQAFWRYSRLTWQPFEFGPELALSWNGISVI